MKDYLLIKDMMATVEYIRALDPNKIIAFLPSIKKEKLFFTGEGSSRIFPAHNATYNLLKSPSRITAITESATQALEYDLNDYTVIAASNSGKTKEVVRLLQHLKALNHNNIIAMTTDNRSPIATLADAAYQLSCGPEGAVSATKSVMEQALFYDLLLRKLTGQPLPDLTRLADLLKRVLEITIPQEIIEQAARAETLYFAGRNNGVAEELTLKANEITRKKSDFLEGTYAVHGIEEVVTKNDFLIIIEPFPQEEEKFKDVFCKVIGLPSIAIASRKTAFTTIEIPEYNDFSSYLQLAAGWNLLLNIGLNNKVDIDRPQRARKIGNVYTETTNNK